MDFLSKQIGVNIMEKFNNHIFIYYLENYLIQNMKYLKILLISLLFIGCGTPGISAQDLRENVYIETEVFQVWYNEILEQPIKLIYTSTNRPKNVDRGNMDFYLVSGVITSDKHDYYKNIYDKGHLAPAATFSDTQENLYGTFTYLNCALQNQDLNRGEWRYLEAEERKWDDEQNLTITVELIFNDGYEVLPTGAAVPSVMTKHIYFENDGTCRKFVFPNQKPTKGWEEYEVTCSN